jgi:hypothetical protein
MLDLFDIGGRVLWEGLSRLDGAPIVALASGLKNRSANSKTGEMLQTWILRKDIKPSDALTTGEDASVCGDCIHRVVGGKGSCYVNVGWGVNQVWRSWRAGKYFRLDGATRDWIKRDFCVRIGSYGDPVAVPPNVWRSILPDDPRRATGYTHMWHHPFAQEYKSFLMASVDSEAERIEANAKGWRAFLVLPLNQDIPKGVGWCPSDELNPSKRVSCEECGLCCGARLKANDVGIYAHGPSASSFGRRTARKPRAAGTKGPRNYDPFVRVDPELHARLREHIGGQAMKPWVGEAIREKLEREQRNG